MKTYNTADGSFNVPDYIVTIEEGVSDSFIFTLTEGELSGTRFKIDCIQVDDNDDSLINYNLHSEGAEGSPSVDILKPIADNIIIGILLDAIEGHKNEISSTSNPDA